MESVIQPVIGPAQATEASLTSQAQKSPENPHYMGVSGRMRALIWVAFAAFSAWVFTWYLNPNFVFDASLLSFCG
jgi:hypothetical protein